MWAHSYHRFADEAAYMAACEAEGWQFESSTVIAPVTVALDPIGEIEGEAPGLYVTAAFMGDPPAAFTATAVTLANPPRVWAS